MDIDEVTAERRRLINLNSDASIALQRYCAPHKGVMGLTSDEARNTDEYKALSHAYYASKKQLELFLKLYKGKEYQKAFKAETIEHFKQKREVA